MQEDDNVNPCCKGLSCDMYTQNNQMSGVATDAIIHGVMLSVLCVTSYWLITHVLVRALSVSPDDDLLEGMWAVVAIVFVYRYGYQQTIAAALSRIDATLLSFVLGKLVENSYIESFNGRLRDECLNVQVFFELADVPKKLERWRQDYNQVRPHSSLHDHPPAIFARH